MAMATATVGLWPLEKYARLVPDKEALPQGSKRGGSWMHYTSSKDAGIQLALLDTNHFMISSGTQIYESFSLWDAHKWIKGVSKGDSILFIYQLKEETTRRFRVKFSAQSPNKTSLETCIHCIAQLSSLIPIKEMGSLTSAQPEPKTGSQSQLPAQMEDSQMFSQVQESNCAEDENGRMQISISSAVESTSGDTVNQLLSISDLAKEVTSQGAGLGKAYADTNFPVNQLGDFIRLCLTDSNFPALVTAVEKELNKIAN